MAESKSSHKIQKLELDSDMAAAAQQLLLLNDQKDNNNHNNSNNINNIDVKKISFDDHQEEIDQQSRNKVSKKKIEEIFETEDEEVCHPKKRKYRSLACIYEATEPICQ